MLPPRELVNSFGSGILETQRLDILSTNHMTAHISPLGIVGWTRLMTMYVLENKIAQPAKKMPNSTGTLHSLAR